MPPFIVARDRRLRHWGGLLRTVTLLAGGTLFLVLLRRVDLDASWNHVRHAGWLLAPAFGCYVAGVLTGARAWQVLLRPRPRFLRLACIHWAGTAVNSVSAAPFGETLKVALLDEGSSASVPSLIVYNALNTAVMLASSAAGALAFAIWFDVSSSVVRTLSVIAAVLFLTVTLGVLLCRWAGLRRVADPRSTRLLSRVTEICAKAAQIPARDACIAGLYLVCMRGLIIGESGLYLRALFPHKGLAWLLPLSLFTQSAVQLLDWGFAFVPGRVGVAEGGAALIYSAVGLDPSAGLAVALLRRCRKVVGVGIGLLAGCFVRPSSTFAGGQPASPR